MLSFLILPLSVLNLSLIGLKTSPLVSWNETIQFEPKTRLTCSDVTSFSLLLNFSIRSTINM